MNLKELKCIENIDINEYLDFYNYIKSNMEYPNWLSDFSYDDITNILKIGGVIFTYYDNDKIVCSIFYIPTSNKNLQKYSINYDETIVGSCGTVLVNPDYRGNHLQEQMLKELENYVKRLNKKYLFTKTHKDNIYSINNFVKLEYKLIYSYISKNNKPTNVYLKKLD